MANCWMTSGPTSNFDTRVVFFFCSFHMIKLFLGIDDGDEDGSSNHPGVSVQFVFAFMMAFETTNVIGTKGSDDGFMW